MASSKLYPTLSKFYGNEFIEFGSELDSLIGGVPEHKLYRKQEGKRLVSRDSKTENATHDQVLKQSRNHRQNKKSRDEVKHHSRDRQPNNDNTHTTTDNQTTQLYPDLDTTPAIPSAPPMEIFDAELLTFVQNALAEHSMSLHQQDTPVGDPNTSSLPRNIILDESWIDDLQPDYDISSEELTPDLYNNLNVQRSKDTKEKSFNLENSTGQPTVYNIVSEPNEIESTPYKQHQKHHRRHAIRKDIDKVPEKYQHGQNRRQARPRQRHPEQEKENKSASMENIRHERPTSPGNPEYNAWMTWRKQVNRQLATVILLRNGGHVRVQKNDISRKPLRQSSFDFVSQIAKSGSKTTLDGKPFVMYGIPRVSLPREM